MAKSIPQFTQFEKDRIDSICLRLGNSKKPSDISNWLTNFEQEEDWENALKISEKIKYYSIDDIISEIDYFLKKIMVKYTNRNIYLSFLAEFGKSGSHLIYYLKKTPSFNLYKDKIIILEGLNDIKTILKNEDLLILLDDIIGTGESTVTFYNETVKRQISDEGFKIKIILLCIAYMSNSTKTISRAIKNFEIFGTPYKKAFIYSDSIFGHRKKMILIKKFCYKYGLKLFSLKNQKTRAIINYPLGYGNSQSLIVFEHSVPNNTLPIIWSSKRSWIPLYPRSTQSRLSNLKKFRKNNIIWINIAKDLGIINKNQDLNSNFWNNIDYRVLALLRLKKRKINDLLICQNLNITLNELEEIYNDGITLKYFDETNNVSELGTQFYNTVLNKRQQQKSKLLPLKDEIIYIPEKFSNRS